MNKPDLFRKSMKDIFEVMHNIVKDLDKPNNHIKIIHKNSYISFLKNTLSHDDDTKKEIIVTYCRFIDGCVYYFTMFIYNFDYGCSYEYGQYNYDKPIHHLRKRCYFNLEKLKNYQHLKEYKVLNMIPPPSI